jgi:hypothetical protein
MKCLACGSEAVTGGTLLDTGGGGGVAFKLDDTRMWKSLLGVGTRPVRAIGCVHCGHLQLAVDFSEKDKNRYQQFEGEQPGLLERLSTEDEKA